MRGKVQQPQQRGSAPWITPAHAGKREVSTSTLLHLRDHPRVCGEKALGNSIALPQWGSPLRMRGKGQGQGDGCDHQGITPACAGKRADGAGSREAVGDHPRVCGEKSAVLPPLEPPQGSPPRMRGKDLVLRSKHLEIGITPAYAGKSGTAVLSDFGPKDHPRVCGEKPFRSNHSTTSEGSPPRVRGKARLHTQLDDQGRITPACAGKSVRLLWRCQ